MSKKIRTEAVDQLFEAILCLKDKEECYTFFEDVCTINELLSLSQRFEVAKMLMDKGIRSAVYQPAQALCTGGGLLCVSLRKRRRDL